MIVRLFRTIARQAAAMHLSHDLDSCPKYDVCDAGECRNARRDIRAAQIHLAWLLDSRITVK